MLNNVRVEIHLFQIDLNVFVTFDQFNAFLLNKYSFLKKNSIFWTVVYMIVHEIWGEDYKIITKQYELN